ncbi:hypothetical protein FRC17_001216 [Serendipita sp. 399]|nr:hypothetical protein FRC17_001216 [Serendipita sp. 399]
MRLYSVFTYLLVATGLAASVVIPAGSEATSVVGVVPAAHSPPSQDTAVHLVKRAAPRPTDESATGEEHLGQMQMHFHEATDLGDIYKEHLTDAAGFDTLAEARKTKAATLKDQHQRHGNVPQGLLQNVEADVTKLQNHAAASIIKAERVSLRIQNHQSLGEAHQHASQLSTTPPQDRRARRKAIQDHADKATDAANKIAAHDQRHGKS